MKGERKVPRICLGVYRPPGIHLMTKYIITRLGGRWKREEGTKVIKTETLHLLWSLTANGSWIESYYE